MSRENSASDKVNVIRNLQVQIDIVGKCLNSNTVALDYTDKLYAVVADYIKAFVE